MKAYKIPGGSMEPTIQIDDRIYVGLRSYESNATERGDIVAYHFPPEPHREFMHRVIGLPGEKIRIQGRRVFINGEPLNERYVFFSPLGSSDPQQENMVETRIPDGHYFMMGDNRYASHDSRYWGFVPRELIVGKALYVYWSPDLSRIGTSLDPR